MIPALHPLHQQRRLEAALYRASSKGHTNPMRELQLKEAHQLALAKLRLEEDVARMSLAWGAR